MDHTLYERVSAPLRVEHFLSRPQIDGLLDEAIQKPLITVVAGAGFGKTQTVLDFLQRHGERAIWLQLSALDNLVTRFWEHLTYSLSAYNGELAAKFSSIGFPENLATFNAFLQIIAEVVEREGTLFLVCDDVHLVQEPSILRMLEELVQAQISGLSIVLISRTDPPISTVGLLSKGLLARITEDHLRLSGEEIASYFDAKGFLISRQAIAEINEITEGWVFAIYLIGLTLQPGVVYEKIPMSVIKFDMFKLMDAEVFSNASKELQDFLIKLSFIDNLQEALLQVLALPVPGLMQEFTNFKSFVRYDGLANCYHLHALFLNFLREKQCFVPAEEVREVHRMAAVWYAKNGYRVEALTHFEKAEAYEEIVPLLSGLFNRTLADFVLDIISTIPQSVQQKMPILKVIQAKNFMTLFRLEEAGAILTGMRDEYEALPFTLEHKALLGEIYCVLGFLSLITSLTDRNYQFVQFFKMADAYLPGGSKLFDSNVHLNKGTYACMIGVQHNEAGSFERYCDAMVTAMPYASRVMNGSGCGAEYLQMTEMAYFGRDLKNAVKYARQAIYKSREKNQYDIENMAIFYLMRIQVALCKYDEVAELLEQMKKQAEKYDSIESYAMLQIAEGWFYASIGQIDKVPVWLMKDTDDYAEISGISFSLYRLVRAKCLLVQKNYYELLAFVEQQNNPYGLQNFLIGSIELKTIQAVALYAMNEKAKALLQLEAAYALAQPNGLLMPFIEQGTHMRTLAKTAINRRDCTIPAQWLENISMKASTYAKKIDRVRADCRMAQKSLEPQPALTQREIEILSNLCNGLTRDEISLECNLSVNTIKSILQNIYSKLGATNSYDAVRIASKMNIML